MPDLVGDLLCILEHAGAPGAIAIGYAKSRGGVIRRSAEDSCLEGMTGVPSWRMRQRVNARTSSRLS